MIDSDTTALAEHAFARHEHLDLAPGIDHLHDLAQIVDRTAARDLSVQLLDVFYWIDGVLRPHMAWEDASLFPAIEAHAGTPWATKLIRFEHKQILAAAMTLRTDWSLLAHELTQQQRFELRGHLFALETLLRAHIEQEERFVLPLLDESARETHA